MLSLNSLCPPLQMWEGFEAAHDGGADSHNHHMFSPVGSWFWRHLAGVQLHDGLRRVEVRPRLRHDHALLSAVQAEVDTPKGRVEVDWASEWVGSKLTLRVTVPANTQARVLVETPLEAAVWRDVALDGLRLVDGEQPRVHSHRERPQTGEVAGVRWAVDEAGGLFEMEVGSGSYAFVGHWQ